MSRGSSIIHPGSGNVTVRRLNRSLGHSVSTRKINSKRIVDGLHNLSHVELLSSKSFSNEASLWKNKSQNAGDWSTAKMMITSDKKQFSDNKTSDSTCDRLMHSRLMKAINVVLLITALASAITALVLQITKTEKMSIISTATSISPLLQGCAFLNFDDITTTTGVDIPNGYGGLNWQNASVYKTGLTVNYSVALVSGLYNAYNFGGGGMLISANATSTFSFYSFYAASPHDAISTLTMIGSRSGTVLNTANLSLNKYYGKYFELNWLDIDHLYFNTVVYIAFDNMCIGVN